MEKNKVSVILPVYNVEQFIEKTINSILNQTYSHLEIIIVDDGSNDNTGEICQKFKHYDNRIQYFYKENGGVSSARNFALTKIRGQYTLFIDGDDFWPKSYVEDLINLKKNNKELLVMTGIDNINLKNKKISEYPIVDRNTIKFDYYHLLRTILQPGGWGGYPVNKLYDSNIIKKNKLMFNETLHFCEDQLFNVKYIRFVEGAAISLTSSNYQRLVHDNSIVNSRGKSQSYNLLWEDVFESKKLIHDLVSKDHKLTIKQKKICLNCNLYAWKLEYNTLSDAARKCKFNSKVLKINRIYLLENQVFNKRFDFENWYYSDKRSKRLFGFFIPENIKLILRK
ncbi:glycosyltransferase family 2 protein [Enterococcus sp. N342-3-1-2]